MNNVQTTITYKNLKNPKGSYKTKRNVALLLFSNDSTESAKGKLTNETNRDKIKKEIKKYGEGIKNAIANPNNLGNKNNEANNNQDLISIKGSLANEPQSNTEGLKDNTNLTTANIKNNPIELNDKWHEDNPILTKTIAILQNKTNAKFLLELLTYGKIVSESSKSHTTDFANSLTATQFFLDQFPPEIKNQILFAMHNRNSFFDSFCTYKYTNTAKLIIQNYA